MSAPSNDFPSNDSPAMIQRLAFQHAARERDLIERLCEIMLTTPDAPGISVQRTWSGEGESLTCTTEAWLDSRMEFGTIGYLPDVHL